MPRSSVAQTQRWLQAVIVHTGSDAEAVAAAGARVAVKPSKTLTSLERVAIYREIYWLRLREALSVDYPALKKYLGDEEFDRLCDAYCQQHPSKSYSLNRLGDHLPKFLESYSGLKRKPFVMELARLPPTHSRDTMLPRGGHCCRCSNQSAAGCRLIHPSIC